jgi:pyridoxine 4-dehydrogenase
MVHTGHVYLSVTDAQLTQPQQADSGQINAHRSGTIDVKLLGTVHRLGFGAMRITGPGIWGEPADREVARQVVRRAVELGVDFIDTADAYGPDVSEQIIAEAIHPYPAGVKIATKVGHTRQGPNLWTPVGRAEYLRQQVELSLRKLRVEQLDLLQLHRIDPKVSTDEQFGELAKLQSEGKVAALGLSEVTVDEIQTAEKYFTVSTVQNRYNLNDHKSEGVLDYCEARGIGFIPWAPISGGRLAADGNPVVAAAEHLNASPAQVALAWLLKRSPVMMPIPGTGSVAHLEENLAAAGLELDDETYDKIAAAA